jgi:hypothetical protein
MVVDGSELAAGLGGLLPEPGGRGPRRERVGVAFEVLQGDVHQQRPILQRPPVAVLVTGGRRRVERQRVADGGSNSSSSPGVGSVDIRGNLPPILGAVIPQMA